MWVLGFDTSNYATSLAVFDTCAGEVVYDKKKFLPVKPGQLRMFQHNGGVDPGGIRPQGDQLPGGVQIFFRGGTVQPRHHLKPELKAALLYKLCRRSYMLSRMTSEIFHQYLVVHTLCTKLDRRHAVA